MYSDGLSFLTVAIKRALVRDIDRHARRHARFSYFKAYHQFPKFASLQADLSLPPHLKPEKKKNPKLKPSVSGFNLEKEERRSE